MVDIITHTTGDTAKGGSLTVEEMDSNLINLNIALNGLEEFVNNLGDTGAALNLHPWIKPTDWLSLDTFDTTKEKVQMLFAIYDTNSTAGKSNFVAFTYTVVGGYFVDWGDGTSENVASGVQAYHAYDFDDTDLSTTLTESGFKQAIITITPQTSSKFSSIDLSNLHPDVTTAYHSNVLLLNVSANEATVVLNPEIADQGRSFDLVKEVNINLPSLLNASQFLIAYSSLEKISYLDISGATNVSYCFSGCNMLEEIPEIDISSATNVSFFISGLSELQYVENIIVSAATSLQYMVESNPELRSIRISNTSAVTDMSYMLRNNFKLKEVAYMDTSSVTNFYSMFSSCYSLASLPVLDTSSGTSFGLMFRDCWALKKGPMIDTSNGTNFDSMFQRCYSLKEAPGYDLSGTSSGTLMLSMFGECSSLREAPPIDFSVVATGLNISSIFSESGIYSMPVYDLSKVNNANLIFNNCVDLRSLPALDFTGASISSGTSQWGNRPMLSRSEVIGVNFDHTYASCNLSATALNEIFTNLETVTSKTITVTGNYGTAQAGYDPTIATAKGWTVVS